MLSLHSNSTSRGFLENPEQKRGGVPDQSKILMKTGMHLAWDLAFGVLREQAI